MLFSYVVFELLFAAMVQPKAVNTDSESPETSLTIANNDFAFKVFNRLSKEGENSVLSPLSINTAFSILMNGADSETLQDMRQFLEYETKQKSVLEKTINEGFKTVIQKHKEIARQPTRESYEPAKLRIASRIYRNESIKLLPEYERTVKQFFNADIRSADFKNNAEEETKKVNDWISNATNHKIDKIFDEISTDTTIIILNAIHFKGEWSETFNKEDTEKLDFYNNGVTPVKTDTMFIREGFQYSESTDLDAELIEMNYIGHDYSFVVVLPKQKNGLKGLKEKLDSNSLNAALNSMKREECNLYFPKFKVQTEYDLNNAFEPKPLFLTRDARFPRLSSDPNIVSEVRHKVYISVDEKGTEAAAVSSIKLALDSLVVYPRIITFRADHPFLYMIRDKKNGMVLFIGQINQF